ncbi:MAG: ATP-binding protein, partial [Halorientalis sp.]
WSTRRFNSADYVAREVPIFESASDALLLVDPDADAIVDCNERAATILGYDDPSALQSVAPSEICREDPTNYQRLVEAVERDGRGRIEGLTCLRRDGGQIPTEVTASTIELGGEAIIIASLRDISDRQRREQALDVFNRVLRHNIRNDMNVVIGHASLIETDVTDDDLAESAAEIRRTGEKLTDLGEKARTVQKLDDRQTDREQVDIRSLLDRVARSVEAAYPEASIDIEGPATADAAVDSTVDVATRELLENAIVHVSADQPTVSVSLSPVDDEHRLAVTISDEGAGLPPQDCAVLEGESETPLSHGSGLGLWLTNWVVTSNGGTVSVVESGDDGTTVRLAFPAGRSESAESTTD